MRKLGLHNQADLIEFAVKLQIVIAEDSFPAG
jgi:hypothetical protein